MVQEQEERDRWRGAGQQQLSDLRYADEAELERPCNQHLPMFVSPSVTRPVPSAHRHSFLVVATDSGYAQPFAGVHV